MTLKSFLMLFILLGRKVKCSEYLSVKIIFNLVVVIYDKMNIFNSNVNKNNGVIIVPLIEE